MIFRTLSYSLLSFPLSLMAITYYVILPKWYAENYAISLTSLGLWLALSRVWDGLSDPLIGAISDYLRQKNISRMLFLRAGVLVLSCSFLLLLNPQFLNSTSVIYVFIIFSLLFYTGLTLVLVPYECLPIELIKDSKARSNFIGGRDFLLILGTIGAALFPLIIKKNINGTEVADLSSISFIYIILLVLFYFFLERWFSLSNQENEVKLNKSSFLKGLSTLKGNMPFQKLIIAFTVNSFGAALPASLFLFFAQYRLSVSENEAYFSLLIYFAVGLLTLPIWLYLSNRMLKKYVWFIAQFINAASFLPVVFLGSGDYFYFLILVSISALGFGGATVLPSLLQADIISYTKLNTTLDIEGVYVGLWSVARKLSQALGAGLALFLLGLSGFDPSLFDGAKTSLLDNTEILNENSKLTLSVLYALVPSVCSLISILIAWNINYSDSK